MPLILTGGALRQLTAHQAGPGSLLGLAQLLARRRRWVVPVECTHMPGGAGAGRGLALACLGTSLCAAPWQDLFS